MRRRTITITILIAGAAIGLLLTAQLRAAPVRQSSYPLAEWQSAQELITAYLEEQSVLKNTIANLRAQITLQQAELALRTDPATQAHLEKLKEGLGLTKLSGDGVEIILDDGSDSLIRAADLRDVMNTIFAQRVSGIALNGQRMIESSTINTTGSTIVVNTVKIAPPFVFEMITDDPGFLLQVLSAEQTLPELTQRVSTEGITFKFRAKSALTLPIYNGAYPLNFLTTTS